MYIIYTHAVYPLIGIEIELPSEGNRTGRGTPFAQHFKNRPFC